MRRGEFMQTFTGRRFHPVDPMPAEVDPVDIAHSLSLLCRYGGHTTRFYSVAEHCVLMSHAVTPEHALAALLHDATEAYVGDMIRPLKLYLDDYVAVERRVWQAIATRFDLAVTLPREVAEADSRILLDERAAVLAPTDDRWVVDDLEPLGVEVKAHAPLMAEVLFSDRLAALLSERAS